MHFWIDKRSQGCGFSGRHLVPPSLGYGRNQRFLCGGLHPKPMVTPVHRFQSIESVANNGLRPLRTPSGCHSRLSTSQNHPPTHHINVAGSSVRPPNFQPPAALELIPAGQTHTPRRSSSPTAKLKCGVWIFFAIITFFLAGAKYYFHGLNIGMEAFVFCSLLVIILILGGLVSLYEAIMATAHAPLNDVTNLTSNQLEVEAGSDDGGGSQVPNLNGQGVVELPPPPYHIAIMLPSQNSTNVETTVQILRDSPPPSYEKAVT